MTGSVLSYPERGHWGKSNWRGNCSGYIYRDVFEMLRPRVFVDPMVGSGTSVEVAREMKIEAYGLDLHSGFNILKQSVLEAVGKPSDLCLAHPPYGNMVVYSGEVWGNEPHPDDLSRCVNEDDFLDKLHLAMLNMRSSVAPGGFYGVLIGDLRKNGMYSSYQAECIARMPKSEHKAVLVKVQHNCLSDKKQYGNMGGMPRIYHEYLLLWQKPESAALASMLGSLSVMARQSQRRMTGTWKSVIWQVLINLGGRATLQDLYKAVEESAPPEKRASNSEHLRPKVRQTLYSHPDTFRGSDDVWEIAAAA